MFKVGQKLMEIDSIWGKPTQEGLYHIIRVNKHTYTLNDGSHIDKETLVRKTKYSKYTYIVPTEKQIKEFIDIKIMFKKTIYLQDFNKELKESKEIINFYLEHRDKIQLDNDEIISNLEYALEYLLDELKSDDNV